MIEQVARALCEAAGKSIHVEPDKQSLECSCCLRNPDGSQTCVYWESFRGEARAAIQAAYVWNKKERRWPAFVK